MNLSQIRESIPSYGRDVKLNLEAVLTPEGAPGLSASQIAGVALACAYSERNLELASALVSEFNIPTEMVEGSKGAATIMAMNNVYYRFLHLAEDAEISKLPAKLRMNIIGKPGIPKADFELMCLAISALAGCGKCIHAHIDELRKASVSDEGLQSAVRIASVIRAAGEALAIQ